MKIVWFLILTALILLCTELIGIRLYQIHQEKFEYVIVKTVNDKVYIRAPDKKIVGFMFNGDFYFTTSTIFIPIEQGTSKLP